MDEKMTAVKRINHVAILVSDLDGSLEFWRDALGLDLSQVEELPGEQAQIAFLPVGDSELELVKPTTADSGLARYLEKRGPGMHHLCLEVEDISGMVTRLKEKGIQLINEEPRKGLDGRKYVFVHPKSANGVLVELYELPG
jgi:methylmalonyl-CoA/ethylmalonyl-CoA epimerase